MVFVHNYPQYQGYYVNISKKRPLDSGLFGVYYYSLSSNSSLVTASIIGYNPLMPFQSIAL